MRIAAELAGGEQMAIETELGRLDIVQGLDGVPTFDQLRSRASNGEVLGVNVAVCSDRATLSKRRFMSIRAAAAQ